MSNASPSGSDDCIIIKKYANRRLYNTESSQYITLDYLAKLTREGKDFKVIDAKTKNDITHNILTQIIMEEESSGQQMLPVSFLRELISMYGNSMQSMIPHYLEASMETFRKNQEKFQEAMKGGFSSNPFAAIAEQNLKMLQAATSAFTPRPGRRPEGEEPSPAASDEIAALRDELKAMQRKIDALGSDKE